jgi:hypothetical protein
MAEAVTRHRTHDYPDSSWARGASVFAGSIMLMTGILQFFQGLTALMTSGNFLVQTPNYVFRLDVTAWGWTHLLLGILVAAAGLAIFTGSPVARGVGIFLAGLSAIANFLWLPYYPFWALALLALDVLVIWGLTKSNLGNF